MFGFSNKKKIPTSYKSSDFTMLLTNDCQAILYPNRLVYSELNQYYKQVSPVYRAIELTATQFASIEPEVQNSEGVPVDDHPLLDLLQNPSGLKTYQELSEEIVSYYRVAGNAFLLATGDISREPQELFSVPPERIQIATTGKVYPDFIKARMGSQDVIFNKRIENRGGRAVPRYILPDGTAEIWHIKTFNPEDPTAFGMGTSPLMPLWYEINQHLYSSNHNLNLLKKGARPSGALIATAKDGSTGTLSQDQFDRLKAELEASYTGSVNAGKPMLLEGGLEWKEMSISNKDMDFATLKKEVKLDIYTTLGIPLAMVSADHMTLDNMGNAKLNLYDDNILPLANKIFAELTAFLMPRYPRSEGFVLSYEEADIKALAPRRMETLERLGKIGILTMNEMRANAGYEALASGGDVIRQPANLIPVASDGFTLDNLQEPAKEEFITLLRKQNKFTEEEITKYTEEADFGNS